MLSPALASALLTASLETGSGGGAELHLPARKCASAEIAVAGPLMFVEDAGPPLAAPRVAPDFVVVEDNSGVGVVCASQSLGVQALRDTVERVRRSAGIDPKIAVVLTSAPLSCGDIFYVPVANDVRGLGYQYVDPREVFDDSPESRLEGIAFLNDFPYWAKHPEEFATVFNHEIGHRWGARVHTALDGLAPSTLLGRQEMHWSYFFDTQGSPLEGNTWTDLGGRRFRASTPLGGGTFSDLDLYLMGVLPKEEVTPARLLLPAVSNARDCKDVTLGKASPPQWCEPLELEADVVPVPVDAVIAAEGEREPVAENVTKTVDIAVIVVDTGSETLTAEGCGAISTAIEQRVEGFATATGGRISLNNLIASESSCEDWSEPREGGGGCAIEHRARARGSDSLMALVAAALISRRCRRRSDSRRFTRA